MDNNYHHMNRNIPSISDSKEPRQCFPMFALHFYACYSTGQLDTWRMAQPTGNRSWINWGRQQNTVTVCSASSSFTLWEEVRHNPVWPIPVMGSLMLDIEVCQSICNDPFSVCIVRVPSNYKLPDANSHMLGNLYNKHKWCVIITNYYYSLCRQ